MPFLGKVQLYMPDLPQPLGLPVPSVPFLQGKVPTTFSDLPHSPPRPSPLSTLTFPDHLNTTNNSFGGEVETGRGLKNRGRPWPREWEGPTSESAVGGMDSEKRPVDDFSNPVFQTSSCGTELPKPNHGMPDQVGHDEKVWSGMTEITTAQAEYVLNPCLLAW